MVDQSKKGGETASETVTGVPKSILEIGVQESETMENEEAVFKVLRIKRENLRGDEGSNSKRKVEIDKSVEEKQVEEMVEFSSGEDCENV